MAEVSPYFDVAAAKKLSEEFLKEKNEQVARALPKIKEIANNQWYEYIAPNIINTASTTDKHSIQVLIKHYCPDELLRKLRTTYKNITDIEYAQVIKNEILDITKYKGFNTQLLDENLKVLGCGMNINIIW